MLPPLPPASDQSRTATGAPSAHPPWLAWPVGAAVAVGLAGLGLAGANGLAGGGGALLAAGGVALAWWLSSRPVHPSAALPIVAFGSPAQGAELMVAQVVPVWQRQLDVTRDNAAEGLSQILVSFSEISGTVDALTTSLDTYNPAGTAAGETAASDDLRQASAALRDQVEQALVGFQFGDRVNQMLSIVSQDMGSFAGWVAAHPGATAADAVAWLATLERSYTMDEQRSHHQQGNVHTERDAVVEFF